MNPVPIRRSKQHRALYDTIQKIFAPIKIIEEYAIKYNGKTYLFDLYVPKFSMAFEVQGEQHNEYNAFMHKGDKGNFVSQVKRDVEKAQACEENEIKLVYVYPKDKITQEFVLNLIIGE